MLRLFVLLFALSLPAAALSEDQTPISRDQITLSFAPVVKRVVPAVVNIYTRHTEKVQISPLLSDPLFGQFFRQGMAGLPKERVVQSLGSGVIVGADGTIVTSYHVVQGSDKITVALSDRREFEGHVEKTDERSDLAVLKVDTKGEKLPTLELRDSDTLEVGDLVLAVGNPFGVGQTVTSGIISALARTSSDVSDYQFFIQTDAAINPGNSGGALVDMQGRLIGINTAIYTRTGGYQGIGFAIPSNMVNAVLKGQAGKSGSVVTPYFGVAVQPVTQEIADAQGLDRPRGVLVEAVSPKSPAEVAGLKPGDIITAVGTGEINDSQGLNFRIATTGIGAPVEMHVWRAGKEIAFPVTFTIPPAEPMVQKVTLKGKHPLNGVTVALLTPEIAQRLNIKTDKPRVVVIEGQGMGLAMSLQPGDIIFAVNGKEVHSISELQRSLSAHAGAFQMTLVRGGMVLNMSVSR
jgi:Do/DeqQ family serine protease